MEGVVIGLDVLGVFLALMYRASEFGLYGEGLLSKPAQKVTAWAAVSCIVLSTVILLGM